MSWATFAIEALKQGKEVQIRPRGHSMRGKVNDRDLVTLAPCAPESLQVGDVVLVRVRGTDYLHLIKAIDGERFQIGNNRGGINGWVGRHAIYGKAINVEPGCRSPRRSVDGPRPAAQVAVIGKERARGSAQHMR